MCIILLKLPKGNVTKRTLKNCWQGNKDGGGLMFVNDDKELIIEKGFFGFRKIYRRFREVERTYPKSKIVLHFRIATSGGISEATCHPFRVTPTIGFAHNGILSKLGSGFISDTEEFNYTVLRRLNPDFLCNNEIVQALEKYACKSFSKFVFLDSDNYHLICNEAAGDWVDDVWFSNSGYKWSTSYSKGYNNEWLDGRYSLYDEYNIPATYKKCELCGLWKPISQMNWSTADGGWLCYTCDYIEKEDNHNTYIPVCKCKMCGYKLLENECITLATGTAYCTDCWHDVITTFTIVCPKCNSSVILDWNECCPECYAELNVEDYAYQLEKLEFC